MTRSTIGGPLGMAELALLHRPAHQQALADARDQLRRCLSALRAVDPPEAAHAAELGNVIAALATELTAIERLQARL